MEYAKIDKGGIMDIITGWVVKGAVILGAVALGAVVATALNRFWDSIAHWLNNTAADVVERKLGYNARKHMERAVARVTKLHERLNNRTEIYIRQSALDTHVQKVTMEASAPLYEQEEEVIEEFKKQNTMIKELEYLG